MSTDDDCRATPVSFDDRLPIATPEGVEVELTLAGIGSRFIAAGMDFAIQIVVITALGFLLRPAGNAGFAVFTTFSFALIFFYDVLFEVLGGGRTPGKLLRLIDILPGFYAVGMTVIFITSRNQRIGDLAAGAYVVRDRHGDRSPAPGWLPQVDTATAATWDMSAVSADDLAPVRSFLERRYRLDPQVRRRLAGQLASRLRPRVGGAPPGMGDEAFLELLVAAKAERA
jgi:uncharacterized RDD family membrane protein YckC